MISVLLAFFLALSCSPGIASCHVGKVHMARNWRWPPAKQLARNWGPQSNNLQGTKSCQQYMNGYDSGFFPSRALRWDLNPGQHLDCSLVRDPEAEDPVKLCLDSWPTETVSDSVCVCCFKLLSFGIIRYEAIDKLIHYSIHCLWYRWKG